MTYLGIETSCDETAAAVVDDGRRVRASVVFSQIALHQAYGGVVPEIASRSHLETLPGVVAQALAEADATWGEIDGVAVTHAPGLASSLLIGLSAAKGLALALDRPLVGIHHLAAHLHAVFLDPAAPAPAETLPLLALLVSGGHTVLVRMTRPLHYEVIGQTLDDAAGEALDKAAQLLGLGYPGGPAIEAAARAAARPRALAFPRGRLRAGTAELHGLDADLCCSFSGLKTALMHHLRREPPADAAARDAIAAAFQEAVVATLTDRCDRALSGGRYAALAAGGGVVLNGALRARLTALAAAHGVPLLLAEPRYCGDNAAMIAGLAGVGGGVRGPAALRLDVLPAQPLDEASSR